VACCWCTIGGAATYVLARVDQRRQSWAGSPCGYSPKRTIPSLPIVWEFSQEFVNTMVQVALAGPKHLECLPELFRHPRPEVFGYAGHYGGYRHNDQDEVESHLRRCNRSAQRRRRLEIASASGGEHAECHVDCGEVADRTVPVGETCMGGRRRPRMVVGRLEVASCEYDHDVASDEPDCQRAIVKMGPPSQCSRRARTVRREPPAETPSGAPYGPRTWRTTFPRPSPWSAGRHADAWCSLHRDGGPLTR
jgi:hypothetical protein